MFNEPVIRRWHSDENMLTTPPSSVPYYYGHITRENAELIIWERGCSDGMYLLRASHNRDAEYVLSIGFSKQVLHYLIQKSGDGMYHLSGVSTDKFAGPIELIENIRPSGLPCLLRIPCLKPLNTFMPGVNCGISEEILHDALQRKATEWGLTNDEMKSMLQNKDNDVWKLIFKTLHESEAWYHGKINRSEAESRLAKSGHANGKFLIRERNTCSFSLSLSFNNQTKHYKIDVLPSGEVGIQEGPKFENIISLVSHYSVFPDGLWCCLKCPCKVNSSTANSPTKEISWPIGRKISKEDTIPEAQPVFPFYQNRVSNGNSILFPNVLSKGKELDSSKLSGAESYSQPKPPKSILKVESSLTTQKVIEAPPKKLPLRPPPPPPIKDKPSINSQAVVDNQSKTLLPRNGSFKDGQPLKDSETMKDQNHNNCVTDKLESKINSSVESPASVESCLVNNNVPKQSVRPIPKTRNLLPLVLPRNENADATLNTNNKSPNLPSTKLSPLTPNSKENKKSSPVSTGPKLFPAPGALPNMSTVIAELKTLKGMIDQPPISSPTLSKETVSSREIVIVESKSSWISSPQSPLQKTLNNQSPVEPTYEEIDPVYEEQKKELLNLTDQAESEDKSGCMEGLVSVGVQESKWDEVEEIPSTPASTKSFTRKPPWTKEESELHFNTIKRHRKGLEVINKKNLVIQDRLGLGNFGEVSKALFKSDNDEVPCAVKTLRSDQIANGKDEILREARIMTKMDHPHIVRLLGICEGESFLLVMELAPLGPLSSYLKRNPFVSNSDIILLMHQVALGMEYLESRQFVHRDLAARNVLLVNENFAKITDFGMSKALGLHSDYYTVEPKGRLPLKWYAPECIYYFKFSSKSDVWSFGISLWEAFSRGGKPYMGLTGREILMMFSNNTRLSIPDNCPANIYDIMMKCWELKPDDRPTFSQLVTLLKDLQN